MIVTENHLKALSMALIVKSSDPEELLKSIRKAIKANKVRTWAVDKEGDFEYVPEQYENDKFWFSPKPDPKNGLLRFGFVEPKNTKIDKIKYGLSHGRFASMILGHFENDFEYIRIPSKPLESLDIVNGYYYNLKTWA